MDADTAEGLTWVILYAAPALAGVAAILPALKGRTPRAALNRGLFMTWGLGILLALVAGWLLDVYYPAPLSRAFETAVVQVPVSFLAGVAVGGLCALRVRLGSTGAADVPADRQQACAADRTVTLLFWLAAGGVTLLVGLRAVEDGLGTGRWWLIAATLVAAGILAAGVRQCLRMLRTRNRRDELP